MGQILVSLSNQALFCQYYGGGSLNIAQKIISFPLTNPIM